MGQRQEQEKPNKDLKKKEEAKKLGLESLEVKFGSQVI